MAGTSGGLDRLVTNTPYLLAHVNQPFDVPWVSVTKAAAATLGIVHALCWNW